jgi:hypothetical protein
VVEPYEPAVTAVLSRLKVSVSSLTVDVIPVPPAKVSTPVEVLNVSFDPLSAPMVNVLVAIWLSTYALFAASESRVGVATPFISTPPKLIALPWVSKVS